MDPLVKSFDLVPGPGSFSEKCQAGFDTGIKIETPDLDHAPNFFPAIMLHQPAENPFER